jgi:hypothetical protein
MVSATTPSMSKANSFGVINSSNMHGGIAGWDISWKSLKITLTPSIGDLGSG